MTIIDGIVRTQRSRKHAAGDKGAGDCRALIHPPVLMSGNGRVVIASHRVARMRAR